MTNMSWYSLVFIAVGVIGVAGLVFWPRIERWLQPKPRTDGHEGATEEFGAELKALRKMAPAPELSLKPAEQMAADHEELDAIGAALDEFGRIVTAELSRFLRHQPTVLLRLPSSVETTGEMPAVVS